MSFLVPAVLPTSRKDLESDIALFEKMKHVTRVQIDTVDGQFAGPASWPYNDVDGFRAMVESGEMLPGIERFEYEIDLMNLDAERAGDMWLTLGASRLTFHAEATTNLPLLLERMHLRNSAGPGFLTGLVSFGVALNLGSDLSLIEPALPLVDYVQFMGIARIGRQGQPFDTHVYDRIRAFKKRYPEMPIQIDGGVKLKEARELALLGVSNVIVGSDLLRAKDPINEAARYRNLESAYGV